MLVYLSGPMSGLPGFNYQAFHAAAARLRELGLDVINPAETAGGVTHLPRDTFMRVDVGYVQASDAVVVIPGWQASKGAKLECILAASLGKPILAYSPDAGKITAQVHLKDWAVAAEHILPSDRRPDPEPERRSGSDSKIIPLYADMGVGEA